MRPRKYFDEMLSSTDTKKIVMSKILNKLKWFTVNYTLFKTNDIDCYKSINYHSEIFDNFDLEYYELLYYDTSNVLLHEIKLYKVVALGPISNCDIFYFTDKNKITDTIKKLSLFVLSLMDYNSLTSMLNRDIVNTILSYYKPLKIIH